MHCVHLTWSIKGRGLKLAILAVSWVGMPGDQTIMCTVLASIVTTVWRCRNGCTIIIIFTLGKTKLPSRVSPETSTIRRSRPLRNGTDILLLLLLLLLWLRRDLWTFNPQDRWICLRSVWTRNVVVSVAYDCRSGSWLNTTGRSPEPATFCSTASSWASSLSGMRWPPIRCWTSSFWSGTSQASSAQNSVL